MAASAFSRPGLQAAWAITTVSPTYAQEIRTPEFGMGLDGLINMRAADLHGIVNGIDADIWNPETDTHLVSTYSRQDAEGARRPTERPSRSASASTATTARSSASSAG